MKSQLYYGAAYYPELWDEKTIEEDIRYMKKVGINVVRMGEFAWAKMEPKQDQIDISFFVDIIDKLYENGIETIICTPTPTPPIWLTHGHPERMYVDADGTVMSHGARQHVCTNNPFFRERSRIIIEAMSKAVGNHPGVIAWQTDNEFKCHVQECMCSTCKKLWHEWLREKYGTIDNLNRAWGTMIWSEYYHDFEQVPQPYKTPFLHNASLSTAYRMFSREKIAEYNDEQIKAIRKYSDKPITHNTGRGFALDNERLFKNLDFASFDAYPNCDQYNQMLLNYDIWRNTKKGKPFWVMETSPSHNGHLHGYQKPHRNGFLTAEVVSAYAMGAQGFSYWLWRQQRTGCELPHSAILSAWGKPTLGFDNVVNAGKAREEIEPIILETKPSQAELAITYSDRARVFFLTESLEKIDYIKVMEQLHHIVLDMGIHRDLIFEGADLEGYKLLMTPFMPYVSDEYLNRAKAFVEKGGIWIVGPLTGWRTGEHTVHTDAGLGNLEKIAGVETTYIYSMTGTQAEGHAFGMSAPLGLLSAVFEPKGAKVMGTVHGGVTPGLAFITEHKIGKGKMVMVGSTPQGEAGKAMIKKIIDHYACEAGISLRFNTTPGTIVAPRQSEDKKVWVIVNMDGKGGSVEIPQQGFDLLRQQAIEPGLMSVGSYEYKIIEF